MGLWPFVRRWAAGLVDGIDVPTAADLVALDEQLSRAANGELWSDVVLLKNFNTSTDVGSPYPNTPVWDPDDRIWYLFGVAGGAAAVGLRSLDGGKVWESVTLTGMPSTVTPQCTLYAQGKLLVGYQPSSGTTTKGVYTSNGFASSSPIVVGAADTAYIAALHHSNRLSLWIASLSDGAIWTADTLGGTWTIRGGLGGPVVTQFAESGAEILGVCPGVNGGYRTTDGLTYSPFTLAGAAFTNLCAIAYVPSPSPGHFVVCGDSGSSSDSTANSVDGLVWASNAGGPNRVNSIVAYGRMLVATNSDVNGPPTLDVYYSLNLGANWKRSGSFALVNTGFLKIALGEEQFIVLEGITTNRNIYPGFRGGL